MQADEKFVVCRLCCGRFSRGGVGKNASTTPLLNHIKKMHPYEYSLLETKKPAKSVKFSFVISIYVLFFFEFCVTK